MTTSNVHLSPLASIKASTTPSSSSLDLSSIIISMSDSLHIRGKGAQLTPKQDKWVCVHLKQGMPYQFNMTLVSDRVIDCLALFYAVRNASLQYVGKFS